MADDRTLDVGSERRRRILEIWWADNIAFGNGVMAQLAVGDGLFGYVNDGMTKLMRTGVDSDVLWMVHFVAVVGVLLLGVSIGFVLRPKIVSRRRRRVTLNKFH